MTISEMFEAWIKEQIANALAEQTARIKALEDAQDDEDNIENLVETKLENYDFHDVIENAMDSYSVENRIREIAREAVGDMTFEVTVR